MGLRHLGRELALQALYQIDISGAETRADLARLSASFPAGSLESADTKVNAKITAPMLA